MAAARARGTLLMRLIRRIVHPSDFSPASRPAFEMAVELARSRRAELLVVHVLPPAPLIADVYVAVSMHDQLRRAHRASGQRRLDGLVAKAERAGVRASTLLVERGTPSLPRRS